MSSSPIALFVYDRPDHTRQTLEALSRNLGVSSFPLYVFSDAAKSEDSEKRVAEVRKIIREISGFRSLEVIERTSNQGLANSLIAGISSLSGAYGRVIVVEDDLITSANFLQFMEEALTRYADVERVMQVSGHIFDVKKFRHRTTGLFLPFVGSWGWGTWKRAWDHFDPLATGWEVICNDLETAHRFDLEGRFDYCTMLKRQMAGELDSWAIRWYLSVFLNRGLVLYPPQSLVRNIGFANGTHGSRMLRWTLGSQTLFSGRVELPEKVAISESEYHETCNAIYRTMGGSVGKFVRTARKLFSAAAR